MSLSSPGCGTEMKLSQFLQQFSSRKKNLDFVWSNKKNEISDISCGGLKLVKILNRRNAQRILWAVKLWNMEDGCFTKQVANSLIGVNDGGYFGLDFLKADKTNMNFHTKDKFY